MVTNPFALNKFRKTFIHLIYHSNSSMIYLVFNEVTLIQKQWTLFLKDPQGKPFIHLIYRSNSSMIYLVFHEVTFI